MKLDLHGLKGCLWARRSVKDDEPTVWNTLFADAGVRAIGGSNTSLIAPGSQILW
jgi:hypothetical protein